jgi:syndecan 4
LREGGGKNEITTGSYLAIKFALTQNVRRILSAKDYCLPRYNLIRKNSGIKTILLFATFFFCFLSQSFAQSSSCSGTKSCFGGQISVSCDAECPTCVVKCLNDSLVACGVSCPTPTPRRQCSPKCCMPKQNLNCDDGKFRPYGTKTCISCLDTGVNKCNNETGYATECSAGYYLTSETCSLCPTGNSCSGGTNQPVLCDAGTYAAAGSTSCSSCAAGTYSAAGSDVCDSCGAGVATCNAETGAALSCETSYKLENGACVYCTGGICIDRQRPGILL